MLFMSIFTYEPGVRDQVIKRKAEKGNISQGLKIIGQWSSVSGGRIFTLMEADDIKAVQAAVFEWSDLGKFETHPVLDAEEVMKILVSKK